MINTDYAVIDLFIRSRSFFSLLSDFTHKCCTALLLSVLAVPVCAAELDFSRTEPAPGNLRFNWIHGSVSAKANTDVRIQVHKYNDHTFILRQNPAIHWEAPFMYLLFGNERAILLDTGATANAAHFPLRQTVDKVMSRWQSVYSKPDIALVVMPLGDDDSQTQGLAQFDKRPNTQLVPPTKAGRKTFPGLLDPQKEPITVDLGGRELTLIATPGLNAQAISVYDPWADLLLTGNSFYPGRLVIRDFDAYDNSLVTLLDFTTAHPVRWILGGRIEMSNRPGMDYRLRANYRPMEHNLHLPASELREAAQIVQLINNKEDIRIHSHFIVMNGVGRGARDYGYPVFVPEEFRAVRLR